MKKIFHDIFYTKLLTASMLILLLVTGPVFAQENSFGFGSEKSKFCKASTCSSSRLCPNCTFRRWCPHGIKLIAGRTCPKCQAAKTGKIRSTTSPAQESSDGSIEFKNRSGDISDISEENILWVPDSPSKPVEKTRTTTFPTRTPTRTTTKTINKKSGATKAINTTPKPRVEKPKKPMTEDEIRAKLGMEPRTETEKFVEGAAKGLLVLGTLGLLGYAILPSKAAAAAKALHAAQAAQAAQAGQALPSAQPTHTTTQDYSPEALQDSQIFEDGDITEAEVELPEPPRKGESRSYTDNVGNQFTEYYNGQNWVDKRTYDSAVNHVADNQAMLEEERIKQQNHDTAFDRQLEQNKIEHQAELKSIHDKNMAEIKANAKVLQHGNLVDQALADKSRAKIELANHVLDVGKTLADVAIPIVGTFAGPPGWAVSTTYTVMSGAGEGAGAAIADPTKSIIGETVKGAAKGVVNAVISEGLNSAMAVGSKVYRAASGMSNAGKALKVGANMSRTGTTFKASLSRTKFHSPIPTQEISNIFRNVSNGNYWCNNINLGRSFSTVTELGKTFIGGKHGLGWSAGVDMAKNSFGKLGNGIFQAAKGFTTDTSIGNYVNGNLWGKG